MRFGSVCSGIEAASVAWNPLGWKAQWLAEIEPFPCAVLAHHYPNTPNLGDMTKFESWPTDDQHAIDLLCGGTPCQSFSVAGLRKGLDDPRGNLMLTFGAIAAKYKPKWIMWENVPGVVSSNAGKDFTSFLDMLEELGYVCDIEILDAQYFGVAQRRRRVFVCGQHRNDLLSQRTDTSALTITQCLQEILQAILTVGCSRLGSAQESSESLIHSKDGAIRRMRLFGLDGESECWPMLRENLIAAFQRYQPGQKQSGAPLGELEKELTQGGQLTDSQAESLFTLTEQSLKNALDEALVVMKSFTTSTATNSITPAQIYTCSKAALLIAKLTQLLSQSSPAFWNSALSSLTAVEEFTNYARSTSSDLFGDLERVQAWLDFIEQAEHASESFLDIGIECFGEIFPLPDCLQGHPAPRREAGKAAPTIHSRSTAGGGLGTDFDCDWGLVMPTMDQRAGRSGANSFATSGGLVPVPHAAISPALKARDHKGVSSDGDGDGAILVPMCLDTTQITSAANYSNPKAGDPCHPLAAQAHVPCIAFPERMSATQCASAVDVAPSMGATNPTAVAFGGDIARTLSARHDSSPCADRGMDVVAYTTKLHNTQSNQAGKVYEEYSTSLDRSSPPPALLTEMQVRRLTPMECARLQGFPDDYLDITVRGKPAPDRPKYKALGNSWAVPNVRWIGQRIDAVAAIRQPSLDLEAA